MAHFAHIDENNIVTRVIVINDKFNVNEFGVEDEQCGRDYCKSLTGEENWIQTSYNSSMRKNYAGIGYIYNEELDAFIPPKPFESYTLDLGSYSWVPPKKCPGIEYIWDEESRDWIINQHLPPVEVRANPPNPQMVPIPVLIDMLDTYAPTTSSNAIE